MVQHDLSIVKFDCPHVGALSRIHPLTSNTLEEAEGIIILYCI